MNEFPMSDKSNPRGRQFEAKVGALLRELEEKHTGFVEVRSQVELTLMNDQVKRPDFELVYRLEQEHRELIECQSRSRSSSEIAERIRLIKALSSRNRFVFVFEDMTTFGEEHKRVLESDGVNCISFGQLVQKIEQLDAVLTKIRTPSIGEKIRRAFSGTWERLIQRLTPRGDYTPWHDDDWFKPGGGSGGYRGPS